MTGARTAPWALLLRRSSAIIEARYAGHAGGWVWYLVHPALLIGLYSLIFGLLIEREVGELGVPYPVFLCAGLLPWLYFADVLGRGGSAFRANRVYLRKLAVPDHVFVGEIAVSAAATLAFQFAVLAVAAWVFGVVPRPAWLGLPLPVVLLGITGFGLSLGLATLHAFFPDVQQGLVAVLRLAVWTAPVIFPATFYEANGLGWLIALNPATAAVEASRDLFILGAWPDAGTWMAMAAWAAASLVFGVVVHRALRSEIRDVV